MRLRVAVLGFFLFTSMAYGQRIFLNEDQSTIRIYHREGKFSVNDGEKYDLRAKQSFTIYPDETITIEIEDPNLFYYKYAWESKDSSETANAGFASAFAQSLLKVIGVLDAGAGRAGGSARLPGKPQIRLAAFREQDFPSPAVQIPSPTPSQSILNNTAVELSNATPEEYTLPTPTGETGVERMINQAVAEVASRPVPAPQDNILPYLKDAGIDKPDEVLQAFKGAVARIYLFGSQIQPLIEQVEAGNYRTAQSTVRDWDLGPAGDTITTSFERMHRAADILSGVITRNIDQIKREGDDQCDLLKTVSAAIDTQKAEGALANDAARLKKLRQEEKSILDSLERLNVEIDRLAYIQDKKDPTKREFSSATYCEDRKAKFKRTAEARAGLKVLITDIVQDPFRNAIVLVLLQEDRTVKALSEIKNFQDTMEAVGKPYMLTKITYQELKDGHGTLRISTLKEVRDFPRILRPTRELRDDSFQFDFNPYSGVQLGVGAAAIYSFVKTHKYEAQAKDGKVVIVDTGGGEYSKGKVGAMLTIVPRKWLRSDLQGLFEIGVSPDDNIGLFAGAGIRYGRYFSFGVGAAFEQVEQLKGNLRVGSEVQSQGDIKTLKHLQFGAYLHLTASTDLGGKK
jgi:hypothetical protein